MTCAQCVLLQTSVLLHALASLTPC